MRFLIIIIISSSLSSAFCQSPFEGLWTDGIQSFWTYPAENGHIQFEGGNLHEGGSMFYGKLVSDSKIRISGRTPREDYSPSFGEVNDMLEYKRIGKYEVLLLSDSIGKLKGILQKHTEQLREIIIKNKINHQLSGKYRRNGSMDVVSFNINEPKVSGLRGGINYEFETEYDNPLDIITMTSASYWYEKGTRTLELFESKRGQSSEFERGELLMKLTLIENFPIVNTELAGDYTFASIIPLIDDILFHYTLEELKLIRNEIFARYGYKFKSHDMQTHFQSQSWYKPISDDVTFELIELEKLNVQLILNAEVRKKKLNASGNH